MKPRSAVLAGMLSLCAPFLSAAGFPPMAGINVVAAENFYGNIAAQLGGEKVNVTSIVSDPSVDWHDYASNAADVRAIAAADLVIENGGGLDDWMDSLLAASPSPARVLLKCFDIAPRKLSDSERVWYDVDDVQAVAQAVTETLKKLDPVNAGYYSKRLQAFGGSLFRVRQKILAMNGKWRGTPVGLTETIFLYLARPIGLSVLTPLDFQRAVSGGKKVKALICSEQTVSAAASRLQDEARAAGIPVVPVTETLPPAVNYQDWMLSELAALERALGS